MFSSLYSSNFIFQIHFKMTSAISFNLDQSKILSSGNGLNMFHRTIQETVDATEEESSDFISVYGSTVIFMIINSTVPMCIQQLPKFEYYATGKHELNVTLTRIFFLRMANLFALISSLYNTITKVCFSWFISVQLFKKHVYNIKPSSGKNY